MTNTEINNSIITYLSKYNPAMIGVFGSYSRGENTSKSDIDLLVDLRSPITLLQLVKIEMDLSEMTGVKIDLITKGALKNKTLIDTINKDLQIIFQA